MPWTAPPRELSAGAVTPARSARRPESSRPAPGLLRGRRPALTGRFGQWFPSAPYCCALTQWSRAGQSEARDGRALPAASVARSRLDLRGPALDPACAGRAAPRQSPAVTPASGARGAALIFNKDYSAACCAEFRAMLETCGWAGKGVYLPGDLVGVSSKIGAGTPVGKVHTRCQRAPARPNDGRVTARTVSAPPQRVASV